MPPTEVPGQLLGTLLCVRERGLLRLWPLHLRLNPLWARGPRGVWICQRRRRFMQHGATFYRSIVFLLKRLEAL